MSSTSAASVAPLLAWLAEHRGTISPKLAFRQSAACGDTLGCFTKEDILEGELLFTVDLECVVSIDRVLGSSIHERVTAIAAQLGDPSLATLELQLWIYMLQQKADKRHFSPYLSSLSERSPCPFEFPDDLIQSLEGTNIHRFCTSEAFDANMRVLSELTKLPEYPSSVYSLQGLMWAKGHYISRRERSLDTIGALVPLLDILNHKSGDALLDLVVADGVLSVHSLTRIHANEEVFSNYGTLSNEKSLYAYGYAIDDNPNDSVTLKLMARPEMATAGLHQGTFYMYVGGLAGIPEELWRAIKELSAVDEDESEDPSHQDSLVLDVEDVRILRDWLHSKLAAITASETKANSILARYGVNQHRELSTAFDCRAASIAFYRDGQRRIVKETLADLDDMILQSSHHLEEGDD